MKFSKFISLSIFPLSLICSSVFLASCSDNNAFYFANFESYMSPNLTSKIKSQHPNVNFRYFPTNEDLERAFVRNYDLAVSSAYLMAKQVKQGLLEELDWTKFNINIIKNGQTVPSLISNAQEALQLFTTPVQTALTTVYDIDDSPGIDGKPTIDAKDNLLRFGVPYFLQDFIVGYKGKSMFDTTIGVSWKEVIDFFSNKVSAQYNKIALIDDYRSIYSIPRIMETQGLGVNVNPPPGDKTTITEFQKTYQYLTNPFSLNSFLLNSDSGTILNNFANPKGSDIGIMYNGDLLYAVQGGDEQFQFLEGDVHFVRPKNTLIVLDMMVINKQKNNKELAYKLINEIALEGVSQDEDITQTEQPSDEYRYGPMQNFDYVQYTTPLEKISKYVLSTDPLDTYFPYSISDPWLQKLCQQIFDVVQTPSNSNMFESGLNDLEKSNMYQAFLREKGNF